MALAPLTDYLPKGSIDHLIPGPTEQLQRCPVHIDDMARGIESEKCERGVVCEQPETDLPV